ncbi:hypothetical protein QTN25_002069 [Entamoeba marina]
MSEFACASSNNISINDNLSEIGRCCDSLRKEGIDALVRLPSNDGYELSINEINFSDNSDDELNYQFINKNHILDSIKMDSKLNPNFFENVNINVYCETTRKNEERDKEKQLISNEEMCVTKQMELMLLRQRYQELIGKREE